MSKEHEINLSVEIKLFEKILFEPQDWAWIRIKANIFNNDRQIASIEFSKDDELRSCYNRSDYERHTFEDECQCGIDHDTRYYNIIMLITNGKQIFHKYDEFYGENMDDDIASIYHKVDKSKLSQSDITIQLFQDLCILIKKQELIKQVINEMIGG
jgi:hypothetical protein